MTSLSGSGWNSHRLGTLNSAIAALGRRSLEDALGVYGGFEGLAEALRAVNNDEYGPVADELEKENSLPSDDGSCPAGFHIETDESGNDICVEDAPGADGSCPPGFHVETDEDGNDICVEDKKKLIAPDIANTFSRLVKDLTEWAMGAGTSERAEALHPANSNGAFGAGGFWFVPNYHAVYQASIDASCMDCKGGNVTRSSKAPYVVPPYSYTDGGAAQVLMSADVLNIPSLHLPFDRDLLNEQYRDLHKDGESSTTTGGAGVLKQQIDYTAAAERAYRLRHATVVRCIMHHSIRKEAHGHEVGVFQRTLTMLQDNLKASTPPGAGQYAAAAFSDDLQGEAASQPTLEDGAEYPDIVAAIDSFLVSYGDSPTGEQARSFIERNNLSSRVAFSEAQGEFLFIDSDDLVDRPYPGGEAQLLIDAQKIIDLYDPRPGPVPDGPREGMRYRNADGTWARQESLSDSKYGVFLRRALTIDEAKRVAQSNLKYRHPPGTPLGDLLGRLRYIDSKGVEKPFYTYHSSKNAFTGGVWLASTRDNPFTTPVETTTEVKGFGYTPGDKSIAYDVAVKELSDPMSGWPSSIVPRRYGGDPANNSVTREFYIAARARRDELLADLQKLKLDTHIEKSGKYAVVQAARGFLDYSVSSGSIRSFEGRGMISEASAVGRINSVYHHLVARIAANGVITNPYGTGAGPGGPGTTAGRSDYTPVSTNSGLGAHGPIQLNTVNSQRDYWLKIPGSPSYESAKRTRANELLLTAPYQPGGSLFKTAAFFQAVKDGGHADTYVG